MTTATIPATYGSSRTPCNVFTLETRRGTWYAVEGSQNVNFTPDEVRPGVDVETLSDTDAFTWPDGIHTQQDIGTAVNA